MEVMMALTKEDIQKRIRDDNADNQYVWLHENLATFLKNVGIDPGYSEGLISAHGDKAYGFRSLFQELGIHFFHGCAIYLITYCSPYSREVRETDDGWVPVEVWMIMNKDRFLLHLPPIV
jgi:hypothetical protein